MAYGEYFGFTQTEVEKLLEDYHLEAQIKEVQKWYNGYLFGESKIYNPWSLINYVKSAIKEHNLYPKPFWSNTSSNAIVKDLIYQAKDSVKAEIEILVNGGTIEKK